MWQKCGKPADGIGVIGTTAGLGKPKTKGKGMFRPDALNSPINGTVLITNLTMTVQRGEFALVGTKPFVNEMSQHSFSPCSIPGSLRRALHTSGHLTLPPAPRSKHRRPCFADHDTED